MWCGKKLIGAGGSERLNYELWQLAEAPLRKRCLDKGGNEVEEGDVRISRQRAFQAKSAETLRRNCAWLARRPAWPEQCDQGERSRRGIKGRNSGRPTDVGGVGIAGHCRNFQFDRERWEHRITECSWASYNVLFVRTILTAFLHRHQLKAVIRMRSRDNDGSMRMIVMQKVRSAQWCGYLEGRDDRIWWQII